MKKKHLFIGTILCCILFLVGCGCKHEWKEATCTEPKTCSKCNETEGESEGHEWVNADCENPKTCSKCEEVEGKANGHKWVEADCENPKTCSVCKKTEGKENGHSVDEWTIEKEATCVDEGTKAGKCTICSMQLTEKIELLDHTPGEWEITKKATSSENGERTKKCTLCSKVLESEEYELTEEEKKQNFKAECKTYTYNEIARNPESYKYKCAKFTGEVIQVIEDGDDYTLRVNVTQGSYYWEDTILVAYTKENSNEARILEDDIITFYGILGGTTTYKTVMGASVTIPVLYATYIDF